MPNIQFQFRRGTSSEWTSANSVLAAGEMGIETNTDRFKIGNGSTAWNALAYGGIQGVQGLQGTLGTQGIIGISVQGIQGIQGATGPQGNATLGIAQIFTAPQTFRAANAIRSEVASTQDAVVIAGRAGGTGSFAVTLIPATLSASRTLTLPEPGENVTLGYLNIPQNSQSAAYTLVLTDAGKHIFHPSADTTARTFTIPANSSVAFPIGTTITFINQNGAGVITIAITTDTMRLSPAGTTGSRTLAANGTATCVKITSTEWIISGSGLT